MNLLFTRSQKRTSLFSIIPLRVGGTVTFRLKAELELTDDEWILARKYSFTKATLIRSDPTEDLANAYRPAFFVSIIFTLCLAAFLPSHIFGGGFNALLAKAVVIPLLGLTGFLVLVFMYFLELRKRVGVDHLTNGGRMFHCHSVVELDEREAELLDICKRFYMTLEKAKNWGGREINPLPDGEPFYLNDPLDGQNLSNVELAMQNAGKGMKNLFGKFSIYDDSRSADPGVPNAARPDPATTRHHFTNQAPGGAPPPSTAASSSSPTPHPLAPKPPTDDPKGF